MRTLAAVVLLPAFLAGGVVMNSSVLLVDVHESDGAHLVVPVPLALAQVALRFAPDEAKYLQAREVAEYLPHAKRVVQALRASPDGVLVEVRERRNDVEVVKEGEILRVRVTEGEDSNVDLDLPLASVAAMLDAYEAERGVFRTSRLIAALKTVPRGQLVHVLDGGDQVEIRMW